MFINSYTIAPTSRGLWARKITYVGLNHCRLAQFLKRTSSPLVLNDVIEGILKNKKMRVFNEAWSSVSHPHIWDKKTTRVKCYKLCILLFPRLNCNFRINTDNICVTKVNNYKNYNFRKIVYFSSYLAIGIIVKLFRDVFERPE